jgi:flagellar FliJ protein
VKQFQFNLEHVLKHRSRLHNTAHEQFLLAKKYLDEGLRELDEIETKVQEYLRDFKKCQAGGHLDSERLKLHLRYLTHLTVTKKIKTQDVVKRQSEMEKRKDRLIKLMKDKKVIEKLKDKRFEQYMTNLLKIDQKILDDTAIGRFIRQKNEESNAP